MTKRIEDILGGQHSLFDIDCDIERLAQGYASRIIISHQDVSDPDDIDDREVDLDSIELSRPRSVGGEHITLEALRFFEIDKKLNHKYL